MLSPLPYHKAIRDYLKTAEPEIWRWYADHRVESRQSDSVKFELLKSTYRIDREEQRELYAIAEEVGQKLALDVPITIYQAQNPIGINASLAPLPSEAHIVLHGPVTTKLSADEQRSLVAHELGHLYLMRCEDEEFLITEQILSALTHDPSGDSGHALDPDPAHVASARLYGLYNEILCDRGSLAVVEDPLVVIKALLKVCTELEDVSADNYLRQAEEIFAKEDVAADDLTHPEVFIRARALKLASGGDPNTEREVARMIEGRPALDELDLVGRQRLSGLTRRFLDRFLSPPWLQTEMTLGHARLFVPEYTAPQPPSTAEAQFRSTAEVRSHSDADGELEAAIRAAHSSIQKYFAYIMLDFVTVDRDLEEFPLAAALSLSEKIGIKPLFCEMARKELRLRKKQLDTIDAKKAELLETVGGRAKP